MFYKDAVEHVRFDSNAPHTFRDCIPFQAKGQTADFGDVQRELSSRWKELGSDDPDRAKFERLAAEDRARFARESAAKDLEVNCVISVYGGRKAASRKQNTFISEVLNCCRAYIPQLNEKRLLSSGGLRL